MINGNLTLRKIVIWMSQTLPISCLFLIAKNLSFFLWKKRTIFQQFSWKKCLFDIQMAIFRRVSWQLYGGWQLEISKCFDLIMLRLWEFSSWWLKFVRISNTRNRTLKTFCPYTLQPEIKGKCQFHRISNSQIKLILAHKQHISSGNTENQQFFNASSPPL